MEAKSGNEPHATRRGFLKNSKQQGNPDTAPRCGAKTRGGTSCKCPAMSNGRCRMHGGKSTGPRTAEGLARSQRANWKHGRYSVAARHEKRLFHQLLRDSKELLSSAAGRVRV